MKILGNKEIYINRKSKNCYHDELNDWYPLQVSAVIHLRIKTSQNLVLHKYSGFPVVAGYWFYTFTQLFRKVLGVFYF